MATAKNAKIQYEAGSPLVPYEVLTDSGDHTIFNPSNPVMSGLSDPEEILPNGITTGVNLLSVHATVDTGTYSAFSANSKGVVKSVVAGTVDFSTARPATDVSKVLSIQMTDAGAVVVVEGVDGTTADFVETFGAAGGPPYILADNVEIGQFRLTTTAAAVLSSGEILQNGTYTERADFPVVTKINNIGVGTYAADAGKVNAYIEFSEALPLSHTGDAAKNTYAKYYTPSFADIAKTSDFVPAETSHSIATEEYYGGSVSSASESLGQCSFKVLMSNGVSDGLVSKKNTSVTIKTFPDRAKSAYLLTQGLMAVSRTYPIGSQVYATVTITPEDASAEFTS